MTKVFSCIRFYAIRSCERMFPPPTLYRLLVPVAALRAVFKKRREALPLPAVIGTGSVVPGTNKSWQNYYMNRTLGFFPKRLAAAEWLNRCSFSGLDRLREVQQSGRPAVIVVCHFGPVYLLRLWLQAAGIRAATLVTGPTGKRAHLDRLKDRETLFPDFPRVFYPHHLRAVKKFLAAGNVLIIAVDKNSGNQVAVPVDDHFNFHMATGALRLAAHSAAVLFPCNIFDAGCWRFQVQLGCPVPEAFLSESRDFVPAGKHLLAGLLPGFRAHPEQCSPMVFDSFRPANANLAGL